MEIFWIEVIVLFGTAIIGINYYAKWAFKYWERRGVPYLEPSFPWGNFKLSVLMKKGISMLANSFYQEFKSKGYKHGGVFAGFKPFYAPIDLDIVKCILIKDFQHFVDRGLYNDENGEPLNASLFNMEGDKWKSLRVRLTPTFTSGKMKYMSQLVIDCSDGLEKEINKFWKEKKPFDIKEIGASFTTNVIGSCAFGLDCNCFENPNNEFRYYTRKFFNTDFWKAIKFAFIIFLPGLCKKLGVRVIAKDHSDFFIKTLKEIINARESNKINRNDFLDLLLKINEGKNKEESFTFNEIAAQAFIFFSAGFETSSSTMTFAFYELTQNQEIQNKIREEIHRVLAKYDGKLCYDAIMEMTYMGQVIDETLRKYPVLSTLNRVCTKDYEIPGENAILEKGTAIFIPLSAIHHDPEYYPDPEKFDPERFSAKNKANRHPCAYMPFGEGPRNCIGMRFGIMQAKIGMTVMLKDYKYSLSPKSPKFELNEKSVMLATMREVLLDVEKV